MPKLEGKATMEGTGGYAARLAATFAPGHFRETSLGLRASSIGLGTYLGEPDDRTDQAYFETVSGALRSGINVLDSAINYRHQRSERSIGRALAEAAASGALSREEIVIATKGGFIAFDGDVPENPADWFRKTFVDSGLVGPEDLVAQCHVMSPAYLENQLECSLRNLGLATVDIYYLHNPETQLPVVGREEFLRRIRLAFRWAEREVAEGRVGVYGLATWDGFRSPADSPAFLDLEELVGVARDVAGEDHHFRVVQLPVNLAMVEAVTHRNQGTPPRPFLEAARRSGITVMSSASILQGRLAGSLPPPVAEALPGLATSAQRALQFARSAPGVATALVGMKNPEHMRENLGLAAVPPLSEADFRARFELTRTIHEAP
jgi:aryl-alcohol dehydrogenase-like predicted oxidoreductase